MVLLTGASRGIGAATARWLAGAGADLVMVARDRGALEVVARGVGGTCRVIVGDLADAGMTDAAVAAARQGFGRLDAVVNNAASVAPLQPLAAADADAWRRAFEVNVLAPLRLIGAALPPLRASAGRVINVVSELGVAPRGGLGAYGATKAALIQLTRVLAVEEPEVTALTYAPGPTDTDMMRTLRGGDGALSEATLERVRTLHREGALADPLDRGRTLAWLALAAPEVVERAHDRPSRRGVAPRRGDRPGCQAAPSSTTDAVKPWT